MRFFYEYEFGCTNKKKLSKNKRRVFLVDLPLYGNLGDQAIRISELSFLKSNCDKLNWELVCSFNNDFFKNLKWIKKNINENDVIICHGGGNIGDQYRYYEELRQITIHEFPNNRIIIFPQTYYFSKTKKGKELERATQKIYSQHKKLTIIAREKFSYKKMKESFPRNRVLLLPDIVFDYPIERLSLSKPNSKSVGFCFRDDVEKKISNQEVKSFEYFCIQNGYQVKKTSTSILPDIDFRKIENTTKVVDAKIREFSNYELLVTDRLHGVIFSMLAGTPCIALENLNYKVKGLVETWLSQYPNIRLLEDSADFESYFHNIVGKHLKYSKKSYNAYFDELANIVFKEA